MGGNVKSEAVALTRKILNKYGDSRKDIRIRLTKRGYQKGVDNCFDYVYKDQVYFLRDQEVLEIISEEKLLDHVPTTLYPKLPVFDCALKVKKARDFLRKALYPAYNDKAKPPILRFRETDIEIPHNTNQDYLCRVIFTNPKSFGKEVSWDKIVEKWGERDPEEGMFRKVYNAAHAVNGKVAKEVGIKDLLVVTTKIIQINSKYLQ